MEWTNAIWHKGYGFLGKALDWLSEDLVLLTSCVPLCQLFLLPSLYSFLRIGLHLKNFLALTLEKAIKESIYQQKGKKGKMCHHTDNCQGSSTCDIIMEEFSPCLPRHKDVIGVRDWETCLV